MMSALIKAILNLAYLTFCLPLYSNLCRYHDPSFLGLEDSELYKKIS